MFSKFQKVLKTLEMILAWFYIGTRFGIIGEPLKRLERSRLEVISGFGAVGALPLPRGTVRFLYEWLIARGSAHTQPSVCAFFHSFLPLSFTSSIISGSGLDGTPTLIPIFFFLIVSKDGKLL